ncbi:hypothetical protein [Vagococcus sp. CY53-2]|uniref:hypothetical protein n=1 Tax=Vagococcus sp. CY53-2 TaxID=2925780 RepID=UPI001F50D5F2|nr:hypothetical protein [Vagococcus sp. CY53-2]MCI0130038.1 hypothetical protein [Vagococcus sp. CY53-2]
MENMTETEKYYILSHMLVELTTLDSKYSKRYRKHLNNFKKCVDEDKRVDLVTDIMMFWLIKTHKKLMTDSSLYEED